MAAIVYCIKEGVGGVAEAPGYKSSVVCTSFASSPGCAEDSPVGDTSHLKSSDVKLENFCIVQSDEIKCHF